MNSVTTKGGARQSQAKVKGRTSVGQREAKREEQTNIYETLRMGEANSPL